MLLPPDTASRAPLSALSLPQLVGNGRMLWFQRLARSEGVAGVLTLGWRFTNEIDVDPWSIRFNAFKFDARDAVVDAAAAVCIKALGDLDGLRGPIAFTAALPANDTCLKASSRLAVLGRQLSDHFRCPWHDDLLSKERHNSLHRHSQLALERYRNIHGKYRCIQEPGCDTLLVCDDFTTTGATLAEIARAVHEQNARVQVIGLALAKTESRSFAAAQGHPLNNNHLPMDWRHLWDRIVATGHIGT